MVYKKFNLFGRRVAIYARRVEYVTGVNSVLPGEIHMPMLDVEGISLRQCECEAARVIDKFDLGPATIFSTGRPDSFHVYFLCGLPFKECMRIAVDFNGVDPNHLVWSLKRKHFTLRITEKRSRPIDYVAYVEGAREPDAFPEMLKSFTKYQTSGLA